MKKKFLLAKGSEELREVKLTKKNYRGKKSQYLSLPLGNSKFSTNKI